MTFKENAYKICIELLNKKINEQRQILNELKQSASNETKSTAGDKHETALAMLQIEQENTNKQLENLLLQKLQMLKINPAVKAVQISPGTLVKTNKEYLFLSIALGKIKVEGVRVVTLSPQSPLGSKLVGLNVNETVTVNGTNYFIESIE